ncbi:phosphotransferase family protein [Clostridium neuense]|uniref:Phosphotransferase family protein n=1 Tax=Clostridium neuense TaxID=1728934 RepID=A0ABW8TLV8_9CLOT
MKISPPEDALIMTYEKNIMFAEIDVMNMLKRKTNLPIAEVLYYDNSHSICKADYFFMSKIPGNSLNSISKEIRVEDKNNIYYELGRLNRRINNIRGKKFGYYSQANKQGNNWYEVFSSMISDVINDAKALNIDIGTKYDTIGKLIERYKVIFEEVEVPKLVHWDLWAGNVFIKNGQITGLIDFERCIWADELMEAGFRSYSYNENFYRGYGVGKLTETQKIRAKWYDLYLFLINALECDYRHYEGREIYNWARQKVIETIEILSNLLLKIN